MKTALLMVLTLGLLGFSYSNTIQEHSLTKNQAEDAIYFMVNGSSSDYGNG